MVKFHTKESEYIRRLEESNKDLRKEIEKLKEEVELWKNANKILRMHDAKMEYENKKLKETIKDHQLY